MSDESGSRATQLVQGARLLAALDATRTAAARLQSEQRAASAGAAEQRSNLEKVQESGQKLGTRSRDLRNTLHLLREAVDRAKLTALNAGLEGARLGDPLGRALVVMGDEVRGLLARAIDALEEHAALLAEVDRDRDRCLAELAELGEGARKVSTALGRAEEQSLLTSALLGELRTDVTEIFGDDLATARALAESAAQVKALASSLSELARRSPASAGAVRALLSPLLALGPEGEEPPP